MKKNPKQHTAPKTAAVPRPVVVEVPDAEPETAPVPPPAAQNGAKDASDGPAPSEGAPAVPGAQDGAKAIPPGRRRFAAKSALKAAVKAIASTDWTEWGVELGGVRAILERGIEQLQQTAPGRGRTAGLATGSKVQIADKHRPSYEGIVEGAMTVTAVVKSMVRVETETGERLVLPAKHLRAAA